MMLNREDLVSLHREYSGERVLSLYLDAEEHDPAKRRAWRRALDHALDDARARMEPGESDGFEPALAHIKRELKRYDDFLPDSGWAGFATAGKLIHAESLPVVMPNLARWEAGIRTAPYVRALKRAQPVITVLANSREARLYRQVNGQFTALPEIHADAFSGDPSDMSVSKRASTHSGVRGITGDLAAQKLEEVGTHRMVKALIEQVRELTGRDGSVVVGGADEIAALVLNRLPRALQKRSTVETSMSFHDSLAELRRAAGAGASVITARRQSQLLAEVLDLARSGGRGCLGPDRTAESLREGRVEVLLLSRRFNGEHPEFSDYYVGSAFEQGADVEEFGGEAGQRLDREGSGIGARLRFTT